VDLETYQRFGLHQNFTDVHGGAVVNGRHNDEIIKALDTPGDTAYQPCVEAVAEGPTRSSVSYFPDWRSSAVYPNTVRDLWIVCPDELAGAASPALLVFNDGNRYLDAEGPVRAQRVLDAVNADGTVGPIVGVFVTPGRASDVPPSTSLWEMNRDPRALRQRSIEYDSMTDRYVSLLVDEVIPFVQDHLGRAITVDPSRRGVAGISSGGICAWTAAWHRPDQFGLVLSHCGSFVNIRGGHAWPYLIRSTKRRQIRVFMQSGENDADIVFGSWSLANQQVAAALKFAGYDIRFEFGTGGHNLRHAGAAFGESLRWLFETGSASAS
jgi:enterochelin esterase-like enzyme